MKNILRIIVVLLFATGSSAQDSGWSRWMLQPHLSLGKLLPGATIERTSHNFFFDSYAPPGMAEYQYAATTLEFGVRAFPEGESWLAVVLGGGIQWFYKPGSSAITSPLPAGADGVGVQLAPKDFTVYPLTIGLQVVTPSALRRDFMLFAGVEGRANFISGDLPMDQSVKPGFGLTAGFAVRVFELGIRYESFSDIRNLGVYLAFRLNPFQIDFSEEE